MRLYENISFNWKDYLFDLHISNDKLEKLKGRIGNAPGNFEQNLLPGILNKLFSNGRHDRLSYEVLDELLTKSGKKRVAVLHAEGDTIEDKWQYADEYNGDVFEIKWEHDVSEIKTEAGITLMSSKFKRIKDGLLIPVEGMIAECHPVDSWILQQDGKGYGALVLVCCNEDKHRPQIQSTPIIYANGNIGMTAEYKTVLLEP